MLGLIIGILLIVILGGFAVFACYLSSGCSRYEGYERKRKK
jgi:hypothetical protein